MKYCLKINYKLCRLVLLILFFCPFIHSEFTKSVKDKEKLISKLHIGSTSSAYTQPMNIHPVNAKAIPTVHNAIWLF